MIIRQKSGNTISKHGNTSVRMSVFVCVGKGLVVFVGMVLLLFTASPARSSGKKGQVYAADKDSEDAVFIQAPAQSLPPLGLCGIVRGISQYEKQGTEIPRVGAGCGTVMVGQRIQRVRSERPDFDLSEPMLRQVEGLRRRAENMTSTATMMSDYDYESLLRIVEAEAGSEDLVGRILVANVILNRVMYEEFPDTVADVIYQYEYEVAQFSPVSDGRIYEVTVSDLTREAVRQAMEGVDYSQGALFFIYKEYADSQGTQWFENDLKYLFKHGVHEFYTYP